MLSSIGEMLTIKVAQQVIPPKITIIPRKSRDSELWTGFLSVCRIPDSPGISGGLLLLHKIAEQGKGAKIRAEILSAYFSAKKCLGPFQGCL